MTKVDQIDTSREETMSENSQTSHHLFYISPIGSALHSMNSTSQNLWCYSGLQCDKSPGSVVVYWRLWPSWLEVCRTKTKHLHDHKPVTESQHLYSQNHYCRLVIHYPSHEGCAFSVPLLFLVYCSGYARDDTRYESSGNLEYVQSISTGFASCWCDKISWYCSLQISIRVPEHIVHLSLNGNPDPRSHPNGSVENLGQQIVWMIIRTK